MSEIQNHWLSAGQTASLMGISVTALAQRRSRARRDSRIAHPVHARFGNQTIYNRASVIRHIAGEL